MTTAEAAFTEDLVEVAGVRIQLRRGGIGAPLLILHSELGVPGWLRAYEKLARHFTVYVPSLPGFGQSGRPRSEEHTSELQSLRHLVCRLLLEKKNQTTNRE